MWCGERHYIHEELPDNDTFFLSRLNIALCLFSHDENSGCGLEFVTIPGSVHNQFDLAEIT